MLLFLSLFAASLGTTSGVAEAQTETQFPTNCVRPVSLMPKPVTSFGAAELDGFVYTVGGYFGKPHDYSREFQEHRLWRMSVETGEWEALSEVGGIQGLALIAHAGRVIRIGGLRIRNADGQPEDLVSVDEVSSYDPATGTWQEWPALPEPRSSHLATVIDDHVYVAGGWALGGEEGPVWHQTMAVLDLNQPEAGWSEQEVPFQRRAVGVGTAGDKLFVLGGISGSSLSKRLDVYHPATDQWVQGPDFPTNAFGVALVGVGDEVFASGMDGVLWKMDANREPLTWEPHTSHLFARFFHQLVQVEENRLLCIGGIGGDTRPTHAERIATDGASIHDWTVWSLPSGGDLAPEQVVLQRDTNLHFLGGRSEAARAALPSQELSVATLAWQGSSDSPRRATTLKASWRSQEGTALALTSDISLSDGTRSVWSFDSETKLWFPLLESEGLGFDLGPMLSHGEAPLLLGQGENQAIYRWDMEEESFALTKASLPDRRQEFGWAQTQDHAVLVGGRLIQGEAVPSTLRIDLKELSIEALPPLGVPRIRPTAVYVQDQLYVLGGTVPGSQGTEVVTVIERFDEGAGAWQKLPSSLPIEASELHAFDQRGRLVLLGKPEGSQRTQLAILELGSRRAAASNSRHP